MQSTPALKNIFYNEDCVSGCKTHLPSNSVDLIITDPPFGIDGDKIERLYSRDSGKVAGKYVEVAKSDYFKFSCAWIEQADRILRPGGSLYIVSGYTNLLEVMASLRRTQLTERNHLIWKYPFGVYTSKKYVSSHYHILYYVKRPLKKVTFNTNCRAQSTADSYRDREDVFYIKKEYKTNEIHYTNQLPTELLSKLILYSSNEGDLICDMFLGSFSTAKVATMLGRRTVGFEISPETFETFKPKETLCT